MSFVKEFVEALSKELQNNGDLKTAADQKAYVKGQFEYFGLRTDTRREIQKPFLVKAFLPQKMEAIEIVKTLWKKPQRDFHYVAQELIFKYVKQLEESDIAVYEYMVTHNSWWDTVDYIATKLIGAYFKKYPEKRKAYVDKWLKSGNMWLQRSALLFQLKYKQGLDEQLLIYTISPLLGSKEFFINKAIGWVLREHSKVNPQWVQKYVEQTSLNNLSKKEALRLMH